MFNEPWFVIGLTVFVIGLIVTFVYYLCRVLATNSDQARAVGYQSDEAGLHPNIRLTQIPPRPTRLNKIA